MRFSIRRKRENIRTTRFNIRAKLAYIVGIIILVALGVFIWWGQQNIPIMQQYVTQYVGVFLDFILGYAIFALVVASSGRDVRAQWKYIAGIVVMTVFGTFTWWADINISPILGTFFSFVLGYVVAVIAFFWILGRYGG